MARYGQLTLKDLPLKNPDAVMYAFIHIPKTAGSTFRQILRESFGARHCDIKPVKAGRSTHDWITPRDVERCRVVYPRLKGIAGHRVTCFSGLQERNLELKFVTILREPHARFLSHFLYHQRWQQASVTPERFLRFCEDPHQRNVQCRWIGGSEDAARAVRALEEHQVFVGLTERFDEFLVLFQDMLNEPSLDIRHRSINRAKNYFGFDVKGSPEMMAALEDANREDGLLYRHATEAIFARQYAAFRGNPQESIQCFLEQNRESKGRCESRWAQFKRNCLYKPLLHIAGSHQ